MVVERSTAKRISHCLNIGDLSRRVRDPRIRSTRPNNKRPRKCLCPLRRRHPRVSTRVVDLPAFLRRRLPRLLCGARDPWRPTSRQPRQGPSRGFRLPRRHRRHRRLLPLLLPESRRVFTSRRRPRRVTEGRARSRTIRTRRPQQQFQLQQPQQQLRPPPPQTPQRRQNLSRLVLFRVARSRRRRLKGQTRGPEQHQPPHLQNLPRLLLRQSLSPRYRVRRRLQRNQLLAQHLRKRSPCGLVVKPRQKRSRLSQWNRSRPVPKLSINPRHCRLLSRARLRLLVVQLRDQLVPAGSRLLRRQRLCVVSAPDFWATDQPLPRRLLPPLPARRPV